MGKIWDSIFNREYKEAVERYYDRVKYSLGLMEYLRMVKQKDDGSYKIKCSIYKDSSIINNLQNKFEESQRIKVNNPLGFGYYCRLESITPNESLEQAERIINLREIIERYQKFIDYLHTIQRDYPKALEEINNRFGRIRAEIRHLDFRRSIGSSEYLFIKSVIDKEDTLKEYVRYCQMEEKYPNGLRLSLRPVLRGKVQTLDSTTEQIRDLEDKFQSLQALHRNYPLLINRIIQLYSLNQDVTLESVEKDVVSKVDKIQDEINGILNGTGISEIQKNVLKGRSADQKLLYLYLAKFASSVSLELENAEDSSTIVPYLLKECTIIDITGVTYKQYCDTLRILEEHSSDISSSLSILKQYRKVISRAYSITENDKLPFSSLTDIYQNSRLVRILEDEKEYRKYADPATSIMRRYPKGYKVLVENGTIKDILKTLTASLQEVKWIADNEALFREEQQRLDEIERREREIRDQAYRIYSNYRKGYDYYVSMGWIKNWFACTSVEDYRKVINYEDQCRTKHEEIFRKERIQSMRNCVSSWHVTRYGFHHDYLYEYLKTTAPREATEYEWDIRHLIWAFKNDPGKLDREYTYSEALRKIIPEMEAKLRGTFGSYLSDLTLVCLPASSATKNQRRWEKFSSTICSDLDMWNGYDHITITGEAIPRHLGGDGQPTLSIDSRFFNGKFIVLVDDIKTTGASIARMKSRLESMGAIVICALTIGITIHE